MEYPPLQHIAAMLISHNGELKGIRSRYHRGVYLQCPKGIHICPEGAELRLYPPLPALPAHAAIPSPIDIDRTQQGQTKSIASANRSVSDPQNVLRLAKFAFEAHALGDLECRDDTALDLLARLSGVLAD